MNAQHTCCDDMHRKAVMMICITKHTNGTLHNVMSCHDVSVSTVVCTLMAVSHRDTLFMPSVTSLM